MLSMNHPLFKQMQEQTFDVLRGMKEPVGNENFFKAFVYDLNLSGICGFLSNFYIKALFDMDAEDFINIMSEEGINCFVIEQSVGTIASSKVVFGVMFDNNIEKLQERIASVNALAKSIPSLLGIDRTAPFKFQH